MLGQEADLTEFKRQHAVRLFRDHIRMGEDHIRTEKSFPGRFLLGYLNDSFKNLRKVLSTKVKRN